MSPAPSDEGTKRKLSFPCTRGTTETVHPHQHGTGCTPVLLQRPLNPYLPLLRPVVATLHFPIVLKSVVIFMRSPEQKLNNQSLQRSVNAAPTWPTRGEADR